MFSGGSLWEMATAGAWQCLRCGALTIPGADSYGNLACPRCGGEDLAR